MPFVNLAFWPRNCLFCKGRWSRIQHFENSAPKVHHFGVETPSRQMILVAFARPRSRGNKKGSFVKGWFWRMCPRSGFPFRGFWRTCPCSGFRSRGTSEGTLVPVVVPGEHVPKPPFFSAKTKRGRREGDGKKNVTTICDKRHDNLRHFKTIGDIL